MINAIIILDGFGKAKNKEISAIDKANMPFFKSLYEKYPSTLINASGQFVGLPDGQMGNSEVGHLNIGAGRIVYQELTRITKSIEDGDFFTKDEFLKPLDKIKKENKKLHIFGLLSDGGVHSHLNHIFALIDLAKQQGIKDVFVHGFMDGRDVSPVSGVDYVKQLQAYMAKTNTGKIGTLIGRYYAMDRDNRWERVKVAYDALAFNKGENTEDPIKTLEDRYNSGQTDEFIEPIICNDSKVEDGDCIIFANFRPDRAREITRAFTQKDFDEFERDNSIKVNFISMTQYDKTFENVVVAFKPEKLINTFGEYVSKLGLKQLRIAETEKYAHVTFFFNGGVEKPNENEDRILVPSPKVATYDLKPEMSAYQVAQKACESMDKYDLMILNFANPDMVGHTGDMNAAIRACEAVDDCLEQVVKRILELGGKCIITADHGNADIMLDDNGNPFTAHTTNMVPFIVVGSENAVLKENGRLCDVVPTLFDMMNIEKPQEMTGQSLILNKQ